MLGVCLVRGVATVALATSHFQLSWMHSIEKIRWTEDWQVTPAGLVIAQASVRGSGAGMEPPAGAVWRDGAWWYRPALPPQNAFVLAASEFTPDHTLCVGPACKPLHEWAPGHGPVRFEPCTVPVGRE